MDPAAWTVIAALARRHGRELAAIAYLVLDNQKAAEEAAAAGIADVLRGTPDAAVDDAATRQALVGATLRRALEAHRTLREVDPLAPGAGPESTATLSSQQRAVAAGHLVAGIDLEALALGTGLPLPRISAELASAEAVAGGREALRRRLHARIDTRSFWITPEAVAGASSLPAPTRPSRPRTVVLSLVLGAVLVTWAAIAALTPSANREGAAAGAPVEGNPEVSSHLALPTRGPHPVAGPAAVLSGDDQRALAECKIQPASTPVSYRGWLSLAALSPTASETSAGTPVYALVTATTAEWVGWQTVEGRPMFPRPVGRMACVVDPVTSKPTVFSVADSWQPPAPMDGCPATPILQHGGAEEIGGPHAFVLLPWNGASWWADDPTLNIRVRIVPTPRVGAHISATAQSLDGLPGRLLEVETTPIPSDRPPTSSHYLWLRGVQFPSEGCWLISVSVDGAVVGAAILSATERPG